MSNLSKNIKNFGDRLRYDDICYNGSGNRHDHSPMNSDLLKNMHQYRPNIILRVVNVVLGLISICTIVYQDQSKNGYDYLRFVEIVSDVGNDLRIAIIGLLMSSQLLPQ